MAADPTAHARPQVCGREVLQWRREQLQAGGTAAELNWLLEFQGGVPWRELQALHLHPECSVPLRVPLEEMAALWQRHRRHQEPLQYLVGCCPWRDLELQVAPGVLIPRQETELLVDLAEGIAAAQGRAPQLWADLGTGSGCLALALAQAWPTSRGIAVDISRDALSQAETNLRSQGRLAQVELRKGHWWTPLRQQWGSLELVVANPPYIPDPVWQELDPLVRDHEPRLALSSGIDGLNAIRVIAAGAPEALAPEGWLLLEHHHDQSEAVQQLLLTAGLVEVQAHADLEGHARFAVARRRSDR